RILETEGKLPEDTLPRVRGRIDREAADREFEIYRAETESDPDNWRSWYRLGLAYDAAGDRKRARAALRDAITMFRSAYCFSDATLETFRNIASNGPRIPARYTMSPIINTMPQCTPSIIQASDHNGLSACIVWGQLVGHTAVISTCTT